MLNNTITMLLKIIVYLPRCFYTLFRFVTNFKFDIYLLQKNRNLYCSFGLTVHTFTHSIKPEKVLSNRSSINLVFLLLPYFLMF